MKVKYSVSYQDVDGANQIMEFVDLKEALTFIENGMHFVSNFHISRVALSK